MEPTALLDTHCGRLLVRSLPDARDLWVVGGFVRDRLLGREPRELDLVTAADVDEIGGRLGELAQTHERFGTARVTAGDCTFDVARMRTESYARPGALPEVSFTDEIEVDLRRRDFTINAIAVRAADGALVAHPGSREDLAAGVLRVLHERSFADDPTRLWRMVRYAVRLGFAPDPRTQELATAAVAAGALATVSGERIGAELRLALAEADPLATLHAAANAGLAPLRVDPRLAGSALQIAPSQARADLILLACCLPDLEWVSGLGFGAAELTVIRRCVEAAPAPSGRPSEIAAALRGLPPEAVAVAGARGDRTSAERWLLELGDVALEIDGDDLIAAGLQPGPEIGERLARTLERKLDGIVSGREDELQEALR